MEAQVLNDRGTKFEGKASLEVKHMDKTGKRSLLESVPVLVILGLLAGAAGGLGIGLIQLRALTSSSSSSTAGK